MTMIRHAYDTIKWIFSMAVAGALSVPFMMGFIGPSSLVTTKLRLPAVSMIGDDKSFEDRFARAERAFYVAHISLHIMIFVMIDSWHLFIFNFIIAEIFISFLKNNASSNFWVARVVLAFYAVGVLTAAAAGKDVVSLHIAFMRDFLYVNVEDLVYANNFLIAADEVIYYHYKYFMVMFLPYYALAGAIFVPLISASIALLFGFLLGYVLTARLTTGLIFLSSAFSAYLFAVFPNTRQRFIDHTIAEGLYSRDGVVDWESRHFLERTYIQEPCSDPIFISIAESTSMDLHLLYGRLITVPAFFADVEFAVDSISCVMIFTVTLISALVHLYSTVYMRSDPHSNRFFGLLSLFTFFMIVAVTGANTVMLFIGWEGVGLSSFLLIAFWYTRQMTIKAASKAMLINKIGDMALLYALSIMASLTGGNTSFAAFNKFLESSSHLLISDRDVAGVPTVDAIAVAIVIAAFVKSAQLFFHTWLPDAMEGPTPVSALLHAATMVTAGVYLVIRFSHLVELSHVAKVILFLGGFATVIFSSLVALAQYDIKKIIAYSTCSQLGLMFFACGLSAYDLALFHFFNHAFFKCLLFLIAGAIIHEFRNEQDIRKMGGLARYMPITFIMFSFAALSLVGFPSFSGAASKDLIILLANFSASNADSMAATLLLYASNVTVALTVAYTARLTYYVFVKEPFAGRGGLKPVGRLSTPSDVASRENVYAGVFSFLAAASYAGGKVFANYFISTEGQFINIHDNIAGDEELVTRLSTDNSLSYIVFLTCIFSIVIAVLFMAYKLWGGKLHAAQELNESEFVRAICRFFREKGYFDEMYGMYIVLPSLKMSVVCSRAIENGVFNFLVMEISKFFILPYKAGLTVRDYDLLDHIFVTLLGIVVLVITAILVKPY